MKESVVIGVLCYVRAEIVRDGLGGLEHADALLRARGVDPETLHVPRKIPKAFRRGDLSMAILRTLRDGPKTGAEIVLVFMKPGDARARVANRVYPALSRLKAKGLVTAEKDRAGRYVWGDAAQTIRLTRR